jgi:hypothetical protein
MSSSPFVPLTGKDETQGPQLIVAATLLWVLAASLVALRFYIRTKIVRVLGADDWTLLAALVCFPESRSHTPFPCN